MSTHAASGTMFACSPPAMRPAFHVGSPRRECFRAANRTGRRSSRPRSSAAILRIALTPSEGREEWAALPDTWRRNRSTPLCATTTARSVGSPTTAPAAAMPASTSAAIPVWVYSSSTAPTNQTSRRGRSRPCVTRASASTIAAIAPLQSQAPRPSRRPSTIRGVKGSTCPVTAGTVSMWASKRSPGPGSRPASLATRFARAGRPSAAG